MSHQASGQVRVGRITYRNQKPVYPSYPDFTPIIVLTKSSPYGELGPYVLKDEQGVIFENYYQACKLYPFVPESRQIYTRFCPKVVWEHPYEVHVDAQRQPNEAYWAWRDKLMNASEAVRYPVGNSAHRGKCLGAIIANSMIEYQQQPRLLDYIEGRKEIYLAEYVRLAKQQPKFSELQRRLAQGENLLIIEIDGPHQESLAYYQQRYGVSESFIQKHTMLASKENLELMLHDVVHPFGHGYCLAMALQGWS